MEYVWYHEPQADLVRGATKVENVIADPSAALVQIDRLPPQIRWRGLRRQRVELSLQRLGALSSGRKVSSSTPHSPLVIRRGTAGPFLRAEVSSRISLIFWSESSTVAFMVSTYELLRRPPPSSATGSSAVAHSMLCPWSAPRRIGIPLSSTTPDKAPPIWGLGKMSPGQPGSPTPAFAAPLPALPPGPPSRSPSSMPMRV